MQTFAATFATPRLSILCLAGNEMFPSKKGLFGKITAGILMIDGAHSVGMAPKTFFKRDAGT